MLLVHWGESDAGAACDSRQGEINKSHYAVFGAWIVREIRSLREKVVSGGFERVNISCARPFAAASGGNYFGARLRDDAGDRDIRSGQRVYHLALTQAGSVVLEGDEVVRFIVAEAAQAVGIGEFRQVA
jgi:hypothetical protein